LYRSMGKDTVDLDARKRSSWAGAAGVAVALGLTELFAGLSKSIPSAISSIGAVVVDITPGWLESFAISTFGTADKAVLAIGIFVVALLIGWFLGRASSRSPIPVIVGFGLFAVLGISAQLAEQESEPALVVATTSIATGVGLLVWYGIKEWTAPKPVAVTDGDVPSIDRRRLLVALGAAATVSVITLSIGRAKIRSRAEAQIAALDLPEATEIAQDPTAENDFDLKFVPPIVVSNLTFYRIDSALVVPTVDPDEWTLTVKGMVDSEVELSYADLTDLPLIERYTTLACVSNEVGDTLVGNALWTGVRLTDVLDLAGVHSGADQIASRSVDGWTAGFPTELAYDGREPLIAVGMNREVLPANHGFPARLVVPGLYGYVSATKWLKEIELTTWDAFDGYWIPRGWAKEGPIKTQSRIDRPKNRKQIAPGSYTFGGVAWAPTLGIERVEVQIDEGPWLEADLTVPLSSNSWIQWSLEAEVQSGPHTVQVRATDGTGETQSGDPMRPKPDGAEGWHMLQFEATEDV
jgi:DMSO/TMAO reductase YedYZ molybdopterin-dependent catalytic subunit